MSDSETSAQIAARFFSGKRADAFNKAEVKTFGNRQADIGLGTIWLKLDVVQMKVTERKFKTLLELSGVVVHTIGECENKVGQSVSHAFFAESDFFMKDVKACLSAILGTPTAEMTHQDILDACADDNPLADMVVEVKGVSKPGKEGTKHEGKHFTNIYWNGEIDLETLNSTLDEKIKATYLPDLAEALAAEA